MVVEVDTYLNAAVFSANDNRNRAMANIQEDLMQ